MMSIKVIFCAISLSYNFGMFETIQVFVLSMITRFNDNEGENVHINFNWIIAN